MVDLLQWGLFLLFSALVLGGALGVFLTMSMYRAGISLMLSLVAMGGLFILLEADLLAVIQVMMNVGGMLVMTLFMVMLMMDPGGEMMWDMKRRMRMKGFGALSMSMPPPPPPAEKSPKRAGGALSPPTNSAGEAGTEDQPANIAENSNGQIENEGEHEMAEKGNEMMVGMSKSAQPNGQAENSDPFRRMREMQRSIAIMQQQLGLMQQQLVELQEDLLQPSGGQQGWSRPAPVHATNTSSRPEETPSHPDSHSHQMAQPQPAAPAAKTAASPTATIYTCPMHPEIRLPNPGRCPKCGMDLVPLEDEENSGAEGDDATGSTPTSKTAPAASAPTVYTCPMHREVRQNGPGRCPKCGMDLVPEGGDGEDGGDNNEGSDVSQQSGSHQHMHGGGGQPMAGSMEDQGQGHEGHDHGHKMHSASSRGGGEVETAEQLQKRSPRAYYRMMEGMAMSTRQLPLAGLFSILAGLLLVMLVVLVAWPARPVAPDLDGPTQVGDLLLSNYMIAFEGAAFLILAGILGAVLLARRERERQRNRQGRRAGSLTGGQPKQQEVR